MTEPPSAPVPERATPPALLTSSEALYQSLLEQMPAVIYVDENTLDARSLYVSPQCETILGTRPERFLEDPTAWEDAIHPDDRAIVDATWKAAFEREIPYAMEHRWFRPDGTAIWVRDEAVLVRDDDGTPLFWQGATFDITAAKRAEEEITASEARYRLLVENIPAVVYQVAPDDDRRTLFVSRQVETALGYSRREWLDQPDIWMELLHPDDREETLAAHDDHNETGAPWSREYRLIASDGRPVWFRDAARLVRGDDGEPLHWLGVQIDITQLKDVEAELRAARDDLERRVHERTAELREANALMALEIAERRRAEAELREAEHRYRTLAEQIPAVTYVWSVERPGFEATWYTSPRIEQVLGYTVEEWHQDADFWSTRLHPDDRQAVLARTMRSEATGEPFQMEYRFLHKDGHIVWVVDDAALLSRDEHGRPDRFQGVMIDVTSRHEAETKARETELRYRTLAEQVPAVIYVVDLERDGEAHISYLSPQVERIFGYPPDRWTDLASWIETIHPDDRARVRSRWRDVEVGGDPYVMDYRLIDANGEVRWVRNQGATISRDALGRPREVQGITIDTTAVRRADRDRRDAEERYRALVEQMPAITYVEVPGDDPNEVHFTYLSPQVERILGRSVDDLMADPGHFGRMLHPDDRDRVIEATLRSNATGEPFDGEYRVVRDDGRIVWLHSRSTLVRGQDGRPAFWHGIAIDVTAHRETEASLRELEERYHRLASDLADEARSPTERAVQVRGASSRRRSGR